MTTASEDPTHRIDDNERTRASPAGVLLVLLMPLSIVAVVILLVWLTSNLR